MKLLLKFLLLAVFLALPVSGIAMNNDHKMPEMDHEKMDHEKMDHKKMGQDHNMDHDSMQMDGAKIPLGEKVVDGVLAKAYLLDVGEAMAKHGMKMTHHLMVEFTEVESGKSLVSGRAAVKVMAGEGKESKAHNMMRMDSAFGTDLELGSDGHYMFRIGTKLDGEKRTFEFKHGMMSHK